MATPRIFTGRYNGAYGIKTALPGFDVTNAADDFDREKRSFNSQWGNVIAKIALVGRGTVSNVGNSIAHGLGYVPYFDARPCEGNVFYDDMYSTFGGININYLWLNQTRINSSALILAARGAGVGPSSAVYIIWTKPLVST